MINCIECGWPGGGHLATCSRHPNRGKQFLGYPDGIGDVRFHYRDGSTHVLRRVAFDTVGGDAHACKNDTSGEFENGEVFHVPNVLWWEVIYE